jgi:hypothetical protein
MPDDGRGDLLLCLGETGNPELSDQHEDAEETLLQSDSGSVIDGDGCPLAEEAEVVVPLGRHAAALRSDVEVLYEAARDAAACYGLDEDV